MSKSDPIVLPPWGERAKRVCRDAWTVFAVLWLATLILRGIDWLAAGDLRGWIVESPVRWPLIVGVYGSGAVILAGGAVWLAGAFAAGWRGPERVERQPRN